MPSWLVEGTGGTPWPTYGVRDVRLTVVTGLVSGLVATGVMVCYRLAVGLAPTDSAAFERFLAYQWVVALAAAIAGTVLVVGDRARGSGLAAVAVPVAAAVGTGGWFVLNVSAGASADPSLAMQMLRPATVLGWYATLVLLPIAYGFARVPAARDHADPRGGHRSGGPHRHGGCRHARPARAPRRARGARLVDAGAASGVGCR